MPRPADRLLIVSTAVFAVACSAPSTAREVASPEPPPRPSPSAPATVDLDLPPSERALHVVDLFKEVEGHEATLVALVPVHRTPPAGGAAKKPSPEVPAEPGSASNCERACAAFRSLSRAPDALCRLAGEGDSRCTAARAKVTAGEQRLRAGACACPPERR
jgi:hypothetical protein